MYYDDTGKIAVVRGLVIDLSTVFPPPVTATREPAAPYAAPTKKPKARKKKT